MINQQTSFHIDIIRGMAALGVIYGHAIYGMGLPLELNGDFCVWVFLVISGYLVGKSLSPDRYGLSAKGWLCFIRNRGLRIIPLYTIVLFIGLIVGTISNSKVNITYETLSQFFFMSPLNNITLSVPLWTVAAEIHFYVFSVLLAVLILRKSNIYIALCFFVISLIVATKFISYSGDNLIQPRTFIGNLHFFVFGLILSTGIYDMSIRATYATYGANIAKAFLVGLMIIAAWFLNNWKPAYFWGLGIFTEILPMFREILICGASLCALALATIVLCVVPGDNRKTTGKPPRKGLFFINFFRWCGICCYGIYVWHSVLGKMNHVLFHITVGPLYLIYLMLALPIAYISYKFIEKPILQHKITISKFQGMFHE